MLVPADTVLATECPRCGSGLHYDYSPGEEERWMLRRTCVPGCTECQWVGDAILVIQDRMDVLINGLDKARTIVESVDIDYQAPTKETPVSKDAVSICVKPIRKPLARTAIRYMGDNDHFLALLKENFSKGCARLEDCSSGPMWKIPRYPGMLDLVFALEKGMWLVRQDVDGKVTLHSDEDFRKEYWVVA